MFHKMRRKRSFVVALFTISSLLLLLTAYQNCGGPLTTLSSSGSTSDSLCEGDEECPSNDGGGGETPPPKEPPPEEPPPGGKERGGEGPDPKTSSEHQWLQVTKRTKAQKTAGLEGGEGWQMIWGIAYAPSNPDTVYMCSDTKQVWKSTDGGTSWQRKGGNFPTNGGASLAVDPTNENIVYVAGSVMGDWADLKNVVEGIIRTTDGGGTWTLVKRAHFHRNYGYGQHIAFAGTNIYAAPSTGGILKSTNGTTWNLLLTSGGLPILSALNLYNIEAHPTDITILFVSATDGLYKVVDSGGSATVAKIGTGLSVGYELVIDPNTPNTMYIAAGTKGVYRSTDGGVTFSKRNDGLSNPISLGGSARRLAMSPANSSRLMVTFKGLWGSHVYYTSDGGANWYQTSNMDEQNADGWIAGSTFGYTTNQSGSDDQSVPIAFHPTNQDIALVAGWGNQFKKTTNGGDTWKYSNTGYSGASSGKRSGSAAIGWDASNSNRAAFSHIDFGSLLTTNNEDTFTSIMDVNSSGILATQAIAMNGDIIVEIVGQEKFNVPMVVAISRNSGTDGSWIYSGATSNIDPHFVSFHPQNSNIVYAEKYRFDNIGTSDTYTTLTKTINGIYKGNGDIVYSHDNNSTVYKSINKGATWTTPYPSLNLPSGYHISQIAVDPTDENRIYAAVPFKGVYIIDNTAANGGTAVLKNHANGIAKDQFNGISTNTVTVDPNNANIVYVGTYAGWSGLSNGAFRSVDKGLTWTNINGNLGPYLNISNLIVNPHNSYVYLNGPTGTWKLPPPTTPSNSQ